MKKDPAVTPDDWTKANMLRLAVEKRESPQVIEKLWEFASEGTKPNVMSYLAMMEHFYAHHQLDRILDLWNEMNSGSTPPIHPRIYTITAKVYESMKETEQLVKLNSTYFKVSGKFHEAAFNALIHLLFDVPTPSPNSLKFFLEGYTKVSE